MSLLSNRTVDSPEDRAAYAGAVLGLLGDRQPLEVLSGTPAELARAIDGVTAERLHAPESPGKWSVGQTLQHLADSEVVWAWRLRLILSHDRPTITGYDQDLWAERLHYDEVDAAHALEVFGVLRRANLRVLARATPEDLQRVGVHSERGEEGVGYLCRLYAGHDLLHLQQIARILASQRR